MKKLFTLVALLTVFMGVNAANWQKVYEKSYSDNTGFPYYVMGYVPEWYEGIMTDFGANYGYKTDAEMEEFTGGTEVGTVTTENGTVYHKVQLDAPGWHQYFIADGIPTQLDGHYKVVAKVKATGAATINVNMGNWGDGNAIGCNVNIPQADDFVEVEWEYTGMPVTSSWLVAQPGTCTETIEWESLIVYEDQEGTRPVVWQQWLTNDGKPIIPDVATESKYVGDAEFGAWPAWALEETEGINANWRTDNAPLICAWALTMGKNFDDKCGDFGQDADRSRPYPADIEAEEGNESNHVFAVHVTQIDYILPADVPTDGSTGGSIEWSNQFWIQAPTSFKSGLSVRLKFRYKAEHACSTSTQWHRKNPSVYLFWDALGSVNFTDQWQEFDKTVSLGTDANNAWSLAFNLCSDATNGRTPNVFYFDDLSWESMKLDEGYFISGINTNVTTKYENLNDAIEFVDGIDADQGNPCLIATVGTKGNDETWVNQVMISTARGDNGAFMASTLKPTGKIKNDPTDWLEYAPSNIAKLDLPGLGVWTVYLDTEYSSMAFQMIEGQEEEEKEPVAVYTYADEIVVNGVEREYTEAEAEAAGIDKPENPGQPWDNQFFIMADRILKAGEVTHLKFAYKASKAAKTTTQTHGAPGAYIHWAAIGDVNFEEDWLEFDADYTVPAEADGSEGKQAQSIAFNMAEIKEACDYTVKEVQWYLVDASLEAGQTYENLISGKHNFYIKVGAGTTPTVGIENVTAKTAKTSGVIYNLAGQRVNNNFKGLVIKDGKKIVK